MSKIVVHEIGRTVREVLSDWPRTIRASVLVVVLTAAWTCYHVLV